MEISERWQEVKRLVQEALDLPPEERDAFLSIVPNEEVRREAAALLAVPTEQAEYFERCRILPRHAPPVRPGDEIGSYRILRPLGHGGMGAVYLAEDARNERRVALKILTPTNAELSADEHRALARLNHPGIATLFESGSTEDGLRYVAMEHVEGMPLARFCEEHCPSLENRLVLFRKICTAVSFAHQRLVVHRDLKPSNILVTSAGEPKLLDFGIAKLLPEDLQDATLTAPSDRSLTIAFASPEQLGAEPTSTATDIYALGVLLNLLLTGCLPYGVRNRHELSWAIRNADPLRPSECIRLLREADGGGELFLGPAPPQSPRLGRELQGDLDAIVLKALRKEADLRYRSVDELSEDVRRYLDQEPVAARRGTRRYLAGKFVRRNRRSVAASALILAILSATALTLFLEQRKTARERDRAEAVTRFLVDMFAVENPGINTGQTVTVHEVLDRAYANLAAAPPQAPEVRGTISQALGKIYLKLGLYTPADALLTPALADLGTTGEYDRPLIVETLADLALLKYHHGRYAEADRYARQALRLRERGAGQGIQLPDVRSLLGRVAFAQGNFPEAERHFRGAVATESRAQGRDHPSVAGALNNLACALHEQGRLSEAEEIHKEALELRRKNLGPIHPDTLQSLHNLSCLAVERGDMTTAEELAQSVSDPQEFNSYDLAYSYQYQNQGTIFLGRGAFIRADPTLKDSLWIRQSMLSDDHPNIGRSLASLGRLPHADHRLDKAEFYYREGLKRLVALPPQHPDRIAAEHNLAVLLAERRRCLEAKVSLQQLLQKTGRVRLRPSIGRTLRKNLAALNGCKALRLGTLSTLHLSALDLTEHSDPPPNRLLKSAASNQQHSVTLFSDDFEDGIIDPARWHFGGYTVKEQDGAMQIRVAVQDRDGWARTWPIPINPRRLLSISRRVKVHAANEYFDGEMKINIVGYPEKRIGVSYANYHYTGNGESVTVGFSIVRRDANSHTHAERKRNASPLLPPIWNQWFTEKIIYDPLTGELRYFINDIERLVYNVDPLPPNARAIIISLGVWGWYTGHYHYLDDLVVSQYPS